MNEHKNMPSPDDLAALYGLQPHVEGGWYAETYRSNGLIPQDALPDGFPGPRCYSTLIMYLLQRGDKSALHRLRQDESWHFYLGGPLELVHISPNGLLSRVRLGQDVLGGEVVQYVVPAGHWFGARPSPGSEFCLLGCAVAPGFDFADFEVADGKRLALEFPGLTEVIKEFTRKLPENT